MKLFHVQIFGGGPTTSNRILGPNGRPQRAGRIETRRVDEPTPGIEKDLEVCPSTRSECADTIRSATDLSSTPYQRTFG
jgi:hypothetical protein